MNNRAIGPLLAVLLLIVGGGAKAAEAAARLQIPSGWEEL
jgi:hypothetical protein